MADTTKNSAADFIMGITSALNLKCPEIKFYDNEFDLQYNSDPEDTTDLTQQPPFKVEDIENVTQLLEFIDYLKKSREYRKSLDYKQLIKLEEPLKELESLIGMHTVKKNIIYQIMYYIKKGYSLNEMLHTAVYGPPGSGKTSLAHIIGKIYLQLGILKNNKFVIGNRSNLIAKYLGQTAIKTKELMDSAKGGVLFIDEVYQLGAARDGNRDSFAKECVDTINQYLTENMGEIVVIVAGYETDVKECFFAQNQGLERRFPWTYDVGDYTPADLEAIFIKQAREHGYDFSIDAIESSFFTTNMKHFTFGGGDTENLMNKCKLVQSMRTLGSVSKDNIFVRDDIERGFKLFMEHKERNAAAGPPPSMYS